MATKRKNFTYDSEIDGDIVKWFESLPSKRHSQYIREAIRAYIYKEDDENFKQEVIKEIKKVLETNDGQLDQLKEGEEDGFVNAETYMKDLFGGKGEK